MVVVSGLQDQLAPIKNQFSDVIHQCLIEVLGLPKDKKIQRFIELEPENFYFPSDRSNQYTIIEINMMEGRTVETKRALIKRLFKEIEQSLKILPIDIEITIHEQPKHCWGFRGMTGDEVQDLDYKIEV